MIGTALFLSEETLKSKTVVTENVDSKMLAQVIWDCQESNVQELLGTPLYERLVKGITDDSLTEWETELLSKHITPVMLFLVLSELPMTLGYKFQNKNILKKSAENAEAPSMSDLADLMKYYKNKSEFYEERTIQYLKNAIVKDATKFLEYQTYTEDIKPKKSGYRCTIVL